MKLTQLEQLPLSHGYTGVGGLPAVEAVDVGEQRLVLGVVGRLGQSFGLGDHRVEVGLGGRAEAVAVFDPAAGEPAAAAEGVDAQWFEVLVDGLGAVGADAVEEAFAYSG
ncbi:hypothetical protein BJ998_007641 [Kutzneria kofuensis]|uniref:Uncharacterized protein n=1 Tax=Kutzneria kofuensis TaxID=103725 RepID=A0A7W9KPN6_9PSEU|nr:hypothetical protein [Kutzneria kofuensis]MBB5896445.1 hypothetical protein [Kutzneria kofuensis]